MGNPDGKEEAAWEEKLAAWRATDSRIRVEMLFEWSPAECGIINEQFIADHIGILYGWDEWALALEDMNGFQASVEYWWEWDR